MILGIDAFNIREGGVASHLVELLHAADPPLHGFERVIVWGARGILSQIARRPWLEQVYEPMLDRSLPVRIFWQRFVLDRLARKAACDLLFFPGSSFSGRFRPFVTMSQNMLPFEWVEAKRFGPSWMLLKIFLLGLVQSRTFRVSDGVIFLTEYAHNMVMQKAKKICVNSMIIPHGIMNKFNMPPRAQKTIGEYSLQQAFRILYVSTVNVYKHQWHVAEAVAILRKNGFPVQLDLIGTAYPPALKRLHQSLQEIDPKEEFVFLKGPIPYSELSQHYHQADLFVFASSCENMPIILLEAMAAGLPIACSNRGPMREILGDAGVYFDPEKPVEIAAATRRLIEDPTMRAEKAELAYDRAKSFTWERCSSETFGFFAKVLKYGGK